MCFETLQLEDKVWNFTASLHYHGSIVSGHFRALQSSHTSACKRYAEMKGRGRGGKGKGGEQRRGLELLFLISQS